MTPILLILIHLFQPPHASKCEWTEWNNLLCYLPLIDNDIVVRYLKMKVCWLHSAFQSCNTVPTYSFSHCTLCSSPLPQSYRVLVLELQARWKINKRNGWEKKIRISTTIKQLLLTVMFDHSIASLSSYKYN